jgi:hypothetical protein
MLMATHSRAWKEPTMDPHRERLKIAIEARAIELRLKLNKVAQRAGMSAGNFLRIRAGEVALTPFAIATIEQALEWEPGSIQAILDGGEPTPRSSPSDLPPAPPGIDPKEWASWDPLDRQMVLAAVQVAQARAADVHSNERTPRRAS